MFKVTYDSNYETILRPEPPKLMRTFKTLCECGNTTHVYNKERLGGVCYVCKSMLHTSKL
jgi:hypothetical protein